jgi:glucokinase
MILAADIGGTSTRLLLGEVTARGWTVVRQSVFASQEYATFDLVLEQFLLPSDTVRVACLAVAGPVLQQRVSVTHLPWQLDSAKLAVRYGWRRAELINDFAAQAYGLPVLSAADLLTLQAGQPDKEAPQLLVGAGTGLGVATRITCGTQIHIIASEGGHADFAPHGAQQQALQAALYARFGEVLLETVVSGAGLENIDAFLSVNVEEPQRSAAAISAAAQRGEAQGVAAMNLFLDCYGSTVGNLALINLPAGGVYVTGGIAPKNAALFNNGRWLTAFCGKHSMQDVLRAIPVHIVMNEHLGLLGAAERASALLRDL